MAETQPLELTHGQIKLLQKLVGAGFEFARLEHVVRHVVVEKSGFVALLDPAEGQFKLFGTVGYRIGEGVGVLVEQNGRAAFVWKKERVEATAELLEVYAKVKTVLAEILNVQPRA